MGDEMGNREGRTTGVFWSTPVSPAPQPMFWPTPAPLVGEGANPPSQPDPYMEVQLSVEPDALRWLFALREYCARPEVELWKVAHAADALAGWWRIAQGENEHPGFAPNVEADPALAGWRRLFLECLEVAESGLAAVDRNLSVEEVLALVPRVDPATGRIVLDHITDRRA